LRWTTREFPIPSRTSRPDPEVALTPEPIQQRGLAFADYLRQLLFCCACTQTFDRLAVSWGGGGGGTGVGNGSGLPSTVTGTNNGQSNSQGQPNNQTQAINLSPVFNNKNTNSQSQSQSQSQGVTPPGALVPEPGAVVLALLGLPALFPPRRRRPATAEPAA
jgi:hypothetical protein